MFLDDLYDLRAELERREVEPAGQTTCDWLKIQELAVSNGSDNDDEALRTLVLNAQRSSVKLPAVRVATGNIQVKLGDREGTVLSLQPDDTIICDIVSYRQN